MTELCFCKRGTDRCEFLNEETHDDTKYYICTNRNNFPSGVTADSVVSCPAGLYITNIVTPELCEFWKFRVAECDPLRRKLQEKYW